MISVRARIAPGIFGTSIFGRKPVWPEFLQAGKKPVPEKNEYERGWKYKQNNEYWHSRTQEFRKGILKKGHATV